MKSNKIILAGSSGLGMPAHINMDFGADQQRWKSAFESAEDLLRQFWDYVRFSAENPIMVTEKVVTRDGVQMIPMPKARPLSKRDFALYCGVSESYFGREINRAIKRWEEAGKTLQGGQMREAMEIVVDTINSQNYSGAAVGIFKEGLTVASLELSKQIQEAREQKAPEVGREDLKRLSQELEDEY